MGQAKIDRTSLILDEKIKGAHSELIGNHIVDVGTKQLVAEGVIIPMDPADCEKLKVLF